MVCPHPDDEVIGCGGMLAKYKQHFDVLCCGSAGVAFGDISAQARSDIRIKEFNALMQYLGIQHHWIFETYGVPPFFDTLNSYATEYEKILKSGEYDYLFLPHPGESHPEHRFITNELFKQLIGRVWNGEGGGGEDSFLRSVDAAGRP
ncbi:hypothetical protein FACS1894139_15950 [Planctomycetales bacterium]|nr:hypothetical protein FACS1894107_13320 [Planctomycetales bacterium]GHT00420.1 hypothetical protein FACS1894108_12430 [Planctomycetales bacterium]GHT07517.1 hypothetical protein FACS1894139_15950 [Planctomycetales bacterium]